MDETCHAALRCEFHSVGRGGLTTGHKRPLLFCRLPCLFLAKIDRPTALIAQSMGGLGAVQAALQRPDLITHLVLTVTSAGADMAKFWVQDWRSNFMAQNPNLPEWFLQDKSNYSDQFKCVISIRNNKETS